MFRNVPCGRPVIGGELCICHSENPEKDVHLFQKEIDEQQARTDLHDFTSFVFPKNFSFMNPEFPKNAYFIHAQFSGEAVFNSAQFSGDAIFTWGQFTEAASFYRARFSGKAVFSGAQFSETADFGGAQFSERAIFQEAKFAERAIFQEAKFSELADFKGAQFSGSARFFDAQFADRADFRWAKFLVEAVFMHATFSNLARFECCTFCRGVYFRECVLMEKARVVFDNEDGVPATFQNEADFASVVMYEGAILAFRKIGIETCRFLETDLRRVQFSDVEFPVSHHRDISLGRFEGRMTRRLHSLFVRPRSCVFDELAPDQKWVRWSKHKSSDAPVRYQYKLIAQLYRHLQTNFMESNRYSEAGDFHIGEQEMRRKDKGPLRRFFCTNVLYKLISNYGESFGRPLAWLLLVLLLFPAIILWGGINPSAASDAASGQPESISYSFSPNPADCFLFQSLDGDYWTVFFKNISFLTFSREKLSAILLSPFQNALAGLQIPLIVTLIAFFLLALRRQFKRKSF